MGELERARLFDLNRLRGDIVAAVEDRILSGHMEAAWRSREHGLEYVLNEAAYFEMSRLEGSPKKRHQEQYDFWHNLALTVGRNAEDENAEILADLVRRYAKDIVGNFNPLVFRLATRAIPMGLSILFNAPNLGGLLSNARQLSDQVIVDGDLDKLRHLADIGTLVLVPTHSSNMDSILLGWSLDNVGLPPVVYGAGKNLFRAPLTAFFMRNLGAYKVDRRLRHSLYKEVLKTVSQVFIEKGFHSLFFPGGTRSRSGEVESRLKLGLAGTALSAFIESLKSGNPRRVFIVPVTLNYHLVLEAETLISDYLRTDGQSRFIIEDDEFSDLSRVLRFVMNTMGMENPLCVRYAPPFDPFGNRVDDDGESYDQQGRRVDPALYVETDIGPDYDPARDREYTRWLGVQIHQSYRENTVLFSIHLVALALLEILRKRHTHWDLYNTIRFGRGEFVTREELVAWCDRLLKMAKEKAAEGKVRLGRTTRSSDAEGLVDQAIRYFTMYHTTPLVRRRGNGVELGHLPLLFYYSNRARGYEFARRLKRS